MPCIETLADYWGDLARCSQNGTWISGHGLDVVTAHLHSSR
jgi:hypothetical protein